MTPTQEHHLMTILNYTIARMSEKYEAGAKEHGGNLTDMSEKDLLDNAIDEAIDQVVYLVTLQQKLKNK